MITFRAARWAGFGAAITSFLLAGMAGSAKAQIGPPTPTAPTAYTFSDSPNSDGAGAKTGWDLLSHGAFGLNENFTVYSRMTRTYAVDNEGFLLGDTGGNTVWQGNGPLDKGRKPVNTLAALHVPYTSGIGYYEYIMNVGYSDSNNDPHTVKISGGINSYAL